MAIYYFTTKIISRSQNKSSVASAAYRSGEKLTDERSGLVHDYTRKAGVVFSEIMTPDDAPDWVKDRSMLWNKVEETEKSKNSQLAREINVALPVDLNAEQKIELVRNFVKENFTNDGMIADVAIHEKKEENPHAHIMLTMRTLTPDGSFGAKAKKEYVLDENGEKIKLPSGEYKSVKICTTNWDNPETLDKWRKSWADFTNTSLEGAGISAHIDHRSYKEQGLERLPTIHMGPAATAMERRGIETEKGNRNREIQEYNKQLEKIKREEVVLLEEYKTLKAELQKENDKWKDFRPEEKKAVLEAKNYLNKFINVSVIRNEIKGLDKMILDIDSKYKELQAKESRFMTAANTVNRIQDIQERIDKTSFFSSDKKELKEALESYVKVLQDSGFKDVSEFKEQYKLFQDKHEGHKETVIESKTNLIQDRDMLKRAESALETVEIRRLINIYPEHHNTLKEMTYDDAKAINKIIKQVGHKLGFEEIKDLCKKADNIINAVEKLKDTDDMALKQSAEKDLRSMPPAFASSEGLSLLRDGIRGCTNELQRQTMHNLQAAHGLSKAAAKAQALNNKAARKEVARKLQDRNSLAREDEMEI